MIVKQCRILYESYDIYLAFGDHEAVKWWNLLHFDAQRIPGIDLERQEGVLGNLPRRDGVASGKKSSAGTGGGAVGMVESEVRVWRRRRQVLRMEERGRGAWDREWRWLWLEKGVVRVWEVCVMRRRWLLKVGVVRVLRLRRWAVAAAAEMVRVAVHSREK